VKHPKLRAASTAMVVEHLADGLGRNGRTGHELTEISSVRRRAVRVGRLAVAVWLPGDPVAERDSEELVMS
jgi:hypothetical protein